MGVGVRKLFEKHFLKNLIEARQCILYILSSQLVEKLLCKLQRGTIERFGDLSSNPQKHR